MSGESASTGEAPASTRPLHVLTLTPFFPVRGDDGQGCFVAEPLSWLEQLGVTNTVRVAKPFYRSGAADDSSPTRARWAGFFSLPGGWGLSSSGAFLFARLVPEIRRIHAAHPVDVIHAHSALPCGHAALLVGRELKIPFVVTVHGLDAFSTRQVGGYVGEWCGRISRSVYRSAKSVICVSGKVRDQVIEGMRGPVRTAVLYNGVDPQMFSPPEREPDARMILSVGNLIPVKGHELLVRAFGAIHEKFPGLSLEIIGDGPERNPLQKLVEAGGMAGKVNFRGRRSRRQVADAMQRATIFALPSRYEGLGCVYLEAMAAGKAVIGCQGQGIEEVIEPGVNGCLIAADDLQGLIDTLTGLLQQDELRQKIGNAARQTVLRAFTSAQQAIRLLELYREARQ